MLLRADRDANRGSPGACCVSRSLRLCLFLVAHVYIPPIDRVSARRQRGKRQPLASAPLRVQTGFPFSLTTTTGEFDGEVLPRLRTLHRAGREVSRDAHPENPALDLHRLERAAFSAVVPRLRPPGEHSPQAEGWPVRRLSKEQKTPPAASYPFRGGGVKPGSRNQTALGSETHPRTVRAETPHAMRSVGPANNPLAHTTAPVAGFSRVTCASWLVAAPVGDVSFARPAE